MNIKIYMVCLMTLMSGLLQASAPAACASSSSVAAPALTPQQEQKNRALEYALYEDDSDEAAAEISRLLNDGARYAGNPNLFKTLQASHPMYENSPKIMQAFINHSSTKKGSTLWHNLQATFIRADVDVLKELAKNKKFDINYRDRGISALDQKVYLSWLDSEYERVLFLRFMGIGEVEDSIRETKNKLAGLEIQHQEAIALGNMQRAQSLVIFCNSAQARLNALEISGNSVHSLLTPEQYKEYREILLERELGQEVGKQNVLTYLVNRQMHPSFASHQKAAQRRAQSLAAAQNEAQAPQHQLKKSHTVAIDDTERPSKKQKKDEEQKDN